MLHNHWKKLCAQHIKKWILLLLPSLFFIFTVSFFQKITAQTTHSKQSWTIMIYLAADNDLSIFALPSLKQLMKIGKTENLSIVVHYFYFHKKFGKVVKTVLVTKEELVTLFEATDPSKTDCGNENNLIDFCTSTINRFPADHYALFFWNHGTGPLEPFFRYQHETSSLFSLYNNFFDRAKAFIPEWLHEVINPTKGICFDETNNNNCLTEEKLKTALHTLKQQVLLEKKWAIIGFDACLMAHIEVASLCAPFANFMIASQDLEDGPGWHYDKALSLFLLDINLTPKDLAQHIVSVFSEIYSESDEHTLSAIELNDFEHRKLAFKYLCTLLLQGLLNEDTKEQLRNIIQMSRHKHACTHFDEQDYIDIIHFYKNMLKHCNRNLSSSDFKTQLIALLEQEIQALNKHVIKNTSGYYHKMAHGLSIYFPARSIHQSYRNNSFGNDTLWLAFLKEYLYR